MRRLRGQELQRVIVRSGGLWSLGDVVRVTGGHAYTWAREPDFPAPAWKVSNSRLYGGQDLHDWLEASGHIMAADRLLKEILSLRVSKL